MSQPAQTGVADERDLSESADASDQPRERRGKGPGEQAMDPWLFFATLALAAMGLVMVYSSSAWTGSGLTGSWEFFLRRQSVFFGLGIAVMLAVSRVDYRILRRFSPQLMAVAVSLLLLVLFISDDINGARRWIDLGPIHMQPSEIAKISLVAFMAATLARRGEQIRQFKVGFLAPMLVAGGTMLLVLLEKDLGTTVLMGMLSLILLYVAGTRSSWVIAAVMTAAPLAWSQIVNVGYRRERVESFLSGDDYQVEQGLIAIGSGGPFGLGLGNGRQKLGFLPENHTDFILATIGEELGLLGILAVIGLYALLVWRGLTVARQAADRFGTYLAIGLSALFGLQALINMAVVLALMPAKGITLPFVSYGGSSLLMSMAAIGVLLSISRRPEPWAISDMRGRGRGSAPSGFVTRLRERVSGLISGGGHQARPTRAAQARPNVRR
ncbi:putative lipid II flippase FtsW [Pseudenhygromyxa sp. WMMC2535]|uniref:putative lipid II flippase FtsW n=1 Tax=Pseudenhygromyxa sp. WMMC2535 TaxID=2712867 RepID=UPI0015572796|nr:putative lipid II flippase FtsW [Pseudenhygromyxa sp. WMMC2535]NVB38503.1 putative lipid II flippase FtsW [Pseudenhygromyxa sp. WMMC2535]